MSLKPILISYGSAKHKQLRTLPPYLIYFYCIYSHASSIGNGGVFVKIVMVLMPNVAAVEAAVVPSTNKLEVVVIDIVIVYRCKSIIRGIFAQILVDNRRYATNYSSEGVTNILLSQ